MGQENEIILDNKVHAEEEPTKAQDQVNPTSIIITESNQESRYIKYITKVVENYDVSKTGGLSIDEYKAYMNDWNKIGGKQFPVESAKFLMAVMDKNLDGKLSIEEFATF